MPAVATRLRLALRKASSLSPGDWWRMALGQVALFRALWDVRTRPRGELVRLDPGSQVSAPAADPHRLARARVVALGVSRAAAYGVFHPTCLVRSLAIVRRFHAEGIQGGAVRVGVARRAGAFTAHAWVEIDGEVVGDDEGTVERYASLDDLHVTPGP